MVHPFLPTMTVSLFEKWSKPSPRSRAMGLTLSIDCLYDTPGVKWGIQRSSLLLAGQVLRIAREHDRLWSSHIKPQGNGGSDVTRNGISVITSDMTQVVVHRYRITL